MKKVLNYCMRCSTLSQWRDLSVWMTCEFLGVRQLGHFDDEVSDGCREAHGRVNCSHRIENERKRLQWWRQSWWCVGYGVGHACGSAYRGKYREHWNDEVARRPDLMSGFITLMSIKLRFALNFYTRLILIISLIIFSFNLMNCIITDDGLKESFRWHGCVKVFARYAETMPPNGSLESLAESIDSIEVSATTNRWLINLHTRLYCVCS